MPKRIVILGADPRQYWVAKTLSEAGHTISVWGVPGLEDTKPSLPQILSDAQAVVLPMPASDRSGNLSLSSGRTVKVETLISLLPQNVQIFGGILPAELCGTDYAASDTVATANAVPTAEGAIQRAMEHLPITLWKSSCLVIGFGRIGKVLAQRLQALGAQVTISARRPGDLALAEALGFGSDRTGVYSKGLEQYDCIFNTVPAMVLPEEQLRRTRMDCLLIDLASRPGGIDFSACARLPRQALHALSLPGLVAPATAGRIISEFILEQL